MKSHDYRPPQYPIGGNQNKDDNKPRRRGRDWIKGSVFFVIALIVSPFFKRLFDTIYDNNEQLFSGNITKVSEFIKVAGGDTLFLGTGVIILVGLFIVLSWKWGRGDQEVAPNKDKLQSEEQAVTKE